jgi:hypothetical protein
VSIYQKPIDDLLALINAKNTTTFTAAQIQIKAMRPTTVGESTKNTKVIFEARSTDTTWRGVKSLYYDRLDLANLGKIVSFLPNGRYRAAVNPGLSAASMLAEIRNSVGIQFDMTDIEDTTTVLAENNACNLLLKAKPGSVGWIGEYVLKFATPPNILTAFFSPNLQGF